MQDTRPTKALARVGRMQDATGDKDLVRGEGGQEAGETVPRHAAFVVDRMLAQRHQRARCGGHVDVAVAVVATAATGVNREVIVLRPLVLVEFLPGVCFDLKHGY